MTTAVPEVNRAPRAFGLALLALVVLGLMATGAGAARAEAPAASFLWFPSLPLTGEPVSLVSISTDPSSPITALAWDVTGNGPFLEAGPAISTTFSSAGHHIVRLRVTDASGASSTVAEAIPVSSPPAVIMEPFPIVRFVAREDGSATKLLLLSVEAPQGAQITVACHGRRCPVKSESRVVPARGVGNVTVSLRRFQRVLPAGIVVELRVSKVGEIGKYTRLQMRRGRPPARLDECVGTDGLTRVACPS